MANDFAIILADGIAGRLSGLFRELQNGVPFSSVLGMNLVGAQASGRVRQLFIFQCDSNDLELVSIFRRWWVVDADGFRWVEKWPLSQELAQSEKFGVEYPFIKFSTDGDRLRFGVLLGPSWYVSREGPLIPGPDFDLEKFVDCYSGTWLESKTM